ncbi:MAG: DUF192 domain-containing protein [Candidatus Altiarchaeales archaeon]|nr:DUF192 domain-containing protein [Candidatus Altiarchaeales archaeon]MBD3416179.1 DUF192 domain-containing protein [Candidatus Altiarchaeales archaeon]
MKLACYLLTVLLTLSALCMDDGTPTVCFGLSCVSVEVADDDGERTAGLMHREGLPPDAGMLFVFEDEGMHSFWMKNTLMPLDMVWLDSDYRVVHVVSALPCESDPCPTYSPPTPSRYVLEVNMGYAEQHGIRVGDVAEVTGL